MVNPLKNIFGQPSFRNHLFGVLEIGYGQFGPTICLTGTLSVSSHVLFINDISLVVTRKTDGKLFPFTWLAFLPHQFAHNEPGADLKMPTRFLVAPGSPHHYNILFSNREQYRDMHPLLKFIKENWEARAEQLSVAATATERDNAFKSFLNQNFVKEGQEKLTALCHWTEGEYLLNIVFTGQENRLLLEVKKTFRLTGAEAADLKMNTDIIIADLCRQPKVTYFTAQEKLNDLG